MSVACIIVDSDDKGGMALNPCVWSPGSLPNTRKVDRAVKDIAWLLGPVNFWIGGWQGCLNMSVTPHDGGLAILAGRGC